MVEYISGFKEIIANFCKFEIIIDYKIINESDDKKARAYTWLDTKYVMLPNVVGLSLDDAKKELKGFRVEYKGNGDTIIEQSPSGNKYVKEGSIVKLMLN